MNTRSPSQAAPCFWAAFVEHTDHHLRPWAARQGLACPLSAVIDGLSSTLKKLPLQGYLHASPFERSSKQAVVFSAQEKSAPGDREFQPMSTALADKVALNSTNAELQALRETTVPRGVFRANEFCPNQ